MAEFSYCLEFTVILILFDNFIFSTLAFANELENSIQTREISAHQYGVNFYAYTDPQSPDTRHEIKIGNKESLKNAGLITGVPIEVYAHGFGGSEQEIQWIDLKKAYFLNGFRNIIFVHWENLKPVTGYIEAIHFTSYFAAIKKYLPAACEKLTMFLSFLIENGYELNHIHLSGHSLGAHLIGCAGKSFYTRFNKIIPRITGLDPAGPFRKMMPPEHILSPKSGAFVDVYHSNIDGFGLPEPIGHVDFYVNGGKGKSQNGCSYKLPPVFSKFQTIICAHPRAVQIYSYAVYKKVEVFGYPCKGRGFTPCKKPAELDKSVAIKAGEYVSQSAKGKYYIFIKDSDIKSMQSLGITIVHSKV